MKIPKSTRQWVSLAWSGVNRLAREARDRRWIEARQLPVRTIGVGNLQAGGTGKTPLTIRIAQEAISRGSQVAILTRGYRSYWEGRGGILAPGDPVPSPDLCGDEAALMRDRVPGVWIGVGANRVAQFDKLQSAATMRTGRGFDLVILDDALQHWKILCDRYVIAITDSPFGDRFFRESFSVVRPQDLVVLTKGARFPSELRDHALRAHIRYRLGTPRRDRRYRFVAALGDPERARESLIEAGYPIQGMTVFPDHYEFKAVEVERILAEASDLSETVLLSGKDWVKWRALGVREDQVDVVEPEIEFLEGEEVWRQFLKD